MEERPTSPVGSPQTVASGSGEPTPPAEEPAESRGFLWRIQALFFEPSSAFADIARRPTFLAAMLLCIVLSIITTALIFSRIDMAEVLRQQIAQSPAAENMTREQIDNQVEQIMASPVFSVMQWVGAVLGSPISMLVIAGVLLLMVYLMGGETSYRKLLAVTAHAYIPYTIVYGGLAVLIYHLAPDPSAIDIQNPVYANLGPLADAKESPVLNRFLAGLDLLNFWVIYLLGTGIAAVTPRFKKSKAIAAVAIPYGLYVLVGMIWRALFS
ncbi:MAG: hypothetical protein Kow00109_20790 [Acidobacteriota bacterium]